MENYLSGVLRLVVDSEMRFHHELDCCELGKNGFPLK